MSADRLAKLPIGSNRHKNQSVSEETSESGLDAQICASKQNSEDTSESAAIASFEAIGQ